MLFPGTYIVNEKGIITAKYFDDDYRERYSAASILTREFGADGNVKESVEMPQIKPIQQAMRRACRATA